MTELWLVRHGQTDWNIQHRFQGQMDTPLNETGLKQAQLLAQNMNGNKFDALYCSPLKRALTTAQFLADHMHLKIQLEPRLKEIGQGRWENMTLDEVIQEFPEDVQEAIRNPLTYRGHGGETIQAVADRMADAANDFARRHPGGRVLVVSHAASLAALICQAKHVPLEQMGDFMPDNAEPTIIDWPPERDQQIN